MANARNLYFRHSDNQKQVASRVLTSLDPRCRRGVESPPEDHNENGQAVVVAFVISTLEATTSDVVLGWKRELLVQV